MKVTKAKLKEIIKEEINKLQTESALRLKHYLKTNRIHSSIPFLAVKQAIGRLEPEMQRKLDNPADPQGQMMAIKAIKDELKNDSSIRRAIGDDDLDRHLNVSGLIRAMDEVGELKPLKPL